MGRRNGRSSVDSPLEFMLGPLLRRRKIATPEFAALLRAEGYDISDSEVYRLVQHQPRVYRRDLLVAICQTLDCAIIDVLLYRREMVPHVARPAKFRLP